MGEGGIKRGNEKEKTLELVDEEKKSSFFS
jgi:hypothetical protein